MNSLDLAVKKIEIGIKLFDDNGEPPFINGQLSDNCRAIIKEQLASIGADAGMDLELHHECMNFINTLEEKT